MRRLPLPFRQLKGMLCSFQAGQRGTQALAGCFTTERQLSSQTASTSGHHTSSLWPFAALPLLGFAAIGTVLADAPNNRGQGEFHLLSLASRQRIFFKYEKRIRDRSSLDKVFEYFSSYETDHQKFLTPVDLLCAVVPTYPPSDSKLDRSGYLEGERTSGRAQHIWNKGQTTFFKQFDVDGDGLISYPEFLLVLTLLSIPGKDVKTIFDMVDLDGNGDIDQEEFKNVMELLQAMAHVHTAKVGRSNKLSIDSESGIFVSFFGKDGSKKLHLHEFQGFLAGLHDELVKLEFAHYDTAGRGAISAVDFARSIVATADVCHVDRLLDKVDAMSPEVAADRISFEDFNQVHQMRRRVHSLEVALHFFQLVGRPVTKDDFVKLVKKLLDVKLAPTVVDVLFAVLGDDTGALDTASFLKVMQRREVMWTRRVSYGLDNQE